MELKIVQCYYCQLSFFFQLDFGFFKKMSGSKWDSDDPEAEARPPKCLSKIMISPKFPPHSLGFQPSVSMVEEMGDSQEVRFQPCSSQESEYLGDSQGIELKSSQEGSYREGQTQEEESLTPGPSCPRAPGVTSPWTYTEKFYRCIKKITNKPEDLEKPTKYTFACLECGMTMKCDRSSSTNLKRHYRRRHPLIYPTLMDKVDSSVKASGKKRTKSPPPTPPLTLKEQAPRKAHN